MFERNDECDQWAHAFRRRFSGAVPIVHKGCLAEIQLAPRLAGEGAHELPRGTPAPAYPVHRYAGCPENWSKRGDAFFVPIPMGADGRGPGLWYDWNGSSVGDYDLAVLPSTAGMNPITGRKADALRLERYDARCPVHEVEFEAERFCPTCAYRWPAQNYVSPPNELWWDGFRKPDGTVRQFFFSNDILRHDVAVAVLGQDRVPAFGFAYFRAQQPRPRPQYQPRRMFYGGGGYGGGYEGALFSMGMGPKHAIGSSSFGLLGGTERGGDDEPVGGGPGAAARDLTRSASASHVRRVAEREVVAVGAGAVISQDLQADPKRLDEWCIEPVAVITVHFIAEEQAMAILEGPTRERTEASDGFLAGLNVQLGAK